MFTPNPEILHVGDKVRLKVPMTTLQGTFSAGHEFTIESLGEYGPEIIDSEGRKMHDLGPFASNLEKI